MYLVTGYAILFCCAARAPLRGRALNMVVAILHALPFLGQGPGDHAPGLGSDGRALADCRRASSGSALVYGPPPLRWLVRGYSDIIRGIPILVLIFAIFYGLPALRMDL